MLSVQIMLAKLKEQKFENSHSFEVRYIMMAMFKQISVVIGQVKNRVETKTMNVWSKC